MTERVVVDRQEEEVRREREETVLLWRIPEKRRTRKMIRVLQTRKKRRTYLDCCLINFVEPGPLFFINVVEP
jgi:hypothetical protein